MPVDRESEFVHYVFSSCLIDFFRYALSSKSNFQRSLFTLLIIFQPALAFADANFDAEYIEESYLEQLFIQNPTFLSLNRTQGQTIGSHVSFTTLEALLFSHNCSNFWSFVDLRGHCFDKGKLATNAGLGCRYSYGANNPIFGINAYYDYRKTLNSSLNQIGVGLELLGDCWNFRCNGYLPVGKKRIIESTCFFDGYTNGYYIKKENSIDTLKGFDFEIESNLTTLCCIDIDVALGGYCYKDSTCNCKGTTLGTQYRLTAYPCNNISLNACVSNDSRFKTRFCMEMCFTIPLSFYTSCDLRFFQPIRRQEVIVQDKRSTYIWNF